MNAIVTAPIEPIVRTQLNFKLDEVPRFWFGGDPFRTRMFDALSLTFPDGERYFIQSVRLFRDQITDPSLAARVSDFIKQEAQHGIAHDIDTDSFYRLFKSIVYVRNCRKIVNNITTCQHLWKSFFIQ